jgi:hypothetical protein
MHPYLLHIIDDFWLAVGAFILLGAFNSKRTLCEERFTAQLPRSLVIAVGFGLVFEPHLGFGLLNLHWLRLSLWDHAVTLVLCFAGFGLILWSRSVLGGNWSAEVALKLGHPSSSAAPIEWCATHSTPASCSRSPAPSWPTERSARCSGSHSSPSP